MQTIRLAAVGALLCALTGTGVAQPTDRRFYVGVDLGQAHLNRAHSDLYASGADRTSMGWKLRFGYRFSPYISIEAAHTSFGDYDGSEVVAFPASSVVPLALAPGDISTSAKGIDVSLVATWPLGESFHLKASAGLVRREFKTVYQPLFAGMPATRGSDGDLASQLGLGLGYTLSESLDISLDWVTSDNLEGDFEFRPNESDPTLLSLGLRLRF